MRRGIKVKAKKRVNYTVDDHHHHHQQRQHQHHKHFLKRLSRRHNNTSVTSVIMKSANRNNKSNNNKVSRLILLQYTVLFLINISLLVVTYFSKFYLFVLATAWICILLDYTEKRSVINSPQRHRTIKLNTCGSFVAPPMEVIITTSISYTRWILIVWFAYSFLPFHFPEKVNIGKHYDNTGGAAGIAAAGGDNAQANTEETLNNEDVNKDYSRSPSELKEPHETFGTKHSLGVEIFPFVIPVFISAISFLCAISSDILKLFRYGKIGATSSIHGGGSGGGIDASTGIGDVILCGVGGGASSSSSYSKTTTGTSQSIMTLEVYLYILSAILIVVPSVDNNIFTSSLTITLYKLLIFNMCVFFMSKALYLKKDVELKIAIGNARIRSSRYEGEEFDEMNRNGDSFDPYLKYEDNNGFSGFLTDNNGGAMEELYFIFGYVWILWASGIPVFLSFIQLLISIHCYIRARTKHKDWITKGMKDDDDDDQLGGDGYSNKTYEDKPTLPSYDAPRSTERRRSVKNINHDVESGGGGGPGERIPPEPNLIVQSQRKYVIGNENDSDRDNNHHRPIVHQQQQQHQQSLQNIIYSTDNQNQQYQLPVRTIAQSSNVRNINRNTQTNNPSSEFVRTTSSPPSSLEPYAKTPPSSGGGGGGGSNAPYKKRVKVVKVRPAKKRT